MSLSRNGAATFNDKRTLEGADPRIFDGTGHHPIVCTLVVPRPPLLRLLLQRIRRVIAPNEALLHKPAHTVHRPRPTREAVKRRRGLRQAHPVDPRKCLRARRRRPGGVAEADAQRPGEKEGLHDAVGGGAVADRSSRTPSASR